MTTGAVNQRFVLAGKVMPMSGGPDCEAIVINDGMIEAVGDRRLAAEASSAGVPVTDLGARVILPGFIDPHVHLSMLASSRVRGVDCRVETCPSINDVLARLSDAATAIEPGSWLEGFGSLFYAHKLAEGRLPTRAELDRVSTTVPIVLHCGGHVSVLNTIALQRSGVERFSSKVAGSWGTPLVELDTAGQPTGVVAEIDQILPIPRPAEDEVRESLAHTYLERFARFGVTTIGEMASSAEEIVRLAGLVSDSRIRGRVFAYVIISEELGLPEAAEWASSFPAQPDTAIRVRGLKMFVDGGYSSHNAAVHTPYLSPYSRRGVSLGQLNLEYPDIVTALRTTTAHGLQLALHANGERAQDEIVKAALDLALDHDFPYLRVEHAGNVLTRVDALPRWHRSGIMPVLQPGFLYDFVGDFLPEILGPSLLHGRLPLRTLLNAGIRPAASSDVGTGNAEVQGNPLFSVQCCVQRHGFRHDPIEPEQAITVPEALRLHTIEAARALGADHEIGSLEAGKRADIVVLAADPTKVATQAISAIPVERVYIGGTLNAAARQGC